MRISICRVVSLAIAGLTLPAIGQDARRQLSEATRDVAARVVPAVAALEGGNGRMMMAMGGARGTAFFVSAEGHLLTDLDLVGDRRRISLRLVGGVRGRANVVARDPINGVALLELEAREQVAARLPGGKISFLEFGDSTGLRAGETVFTAGNAFDSLAVDGVPAFSRGVVSRVGRLREGSYRGVMIETDAAVNPGSFGGPLLDRSGRVVGVISQEFSARRFLGVAIPGQQVRVSYAALRSGRPPARGLLGVFVRARGGEAASDGLEVLQVAPGSPAAAAGLMVGDRLIELDGLRLRDEADLAGELNGLPPGSPVAVRVKRGGADRQLEVVLGEGEPLAVAQAPTPPQPPVRPAPQPPARPQERPQGRQRPALGVQVSERESGGLSVVAVEPQGAAQLAGIQAGDAMLLFDGKALGSMDDLRLALAAKAAGETVTVRIEREGWRQDLKVKLGSAPVEESAPTPAPTPAPAPTKAGPGWLGVALRPESTHPGALVEDVEPGSPAAAAGLAAGDLVVRADGRPVSALNDLVAVLRTKRAGDTIKLHVIGPKGERDVVATLAPRPGQAGAPAPAPAPAASGPWLGAALEEGNGGLTLVELDPRGPLAKLKLEKGDVLIALEGKKLTSFEQLAGLLQGKKPGDKVRLAVSRKGWEKEFTLELGRKPE